MSKQFDSAWLARYENKSRRPVPHTQQRQLPETLARGDEGKTPSTGRPVVRFRLRRVKLLDVDAKWASVKDLLDGLQHASLIHSDKEGEIDLDVKQDQVPSYDCERTEIEIEYDDTETIG